MSREKLHGVEPPVVTSVGEVGEVGSHAEAAVIICGAHQGELERTAVLHPHLSESPVCSVVAELS